MNETCEGGLIYAGRLKAATETLQKEHESAFKSSQTTNCMRLIRAT